MSPQEYALLMTTGFVQESRSGTTHAAFPADQTAFYAQAAVGSVYVEFEVPHDNIKPTRPGWAKILGPHTLEARLAAAKGLPIPERPPAKNIQYICTK